jgi:hypothetical protein
MVHHDNRDYNQAKSEAATKMKDKLTSIFDSGRRNVQAALQHVIDQKVDDQLAPPEVLLFNPILGEQDGSHRVDLKVKDQRYELHAHAAQQVYSKLGLPKRYADDLIGTRWGAELLAHNLNTLMGHQKDRFLLRSVGSSLRAVLSDRFRRMDSGPLVESFITAIKETGAVPLEGRNLDTKFLMRFILPVMFEPVPNEVIAFGLEFRNSDFGDGRLAISEFVYRMWCTNLAVGADYIRKTHLGTRLSDDMLYSHETYQLDTKTVASAITDTVRAALLPANINRRVEVIQQAAQEVGTGELVAALAAMKNKGKLLKTEEGLVLETFRSPDVQLLPPGNSYWRLSNAISLLASKTDDAGRSIELQGLAGEVAGLTRELV